MLAAGGRSGGKQIVSQATLAEMWTPQLVAEDIGFGLGFKIGKLRSHKTVSHNGAVYGHSTALIFLPDVKIGVVLLCNEDIVNGIVGRLAELARKPDAGSETWPGGAARARDDRIGS